MIKTLECCCCRQPTKGRQWWNRDTGYGHCDECTELYDKLTPLGFTNELFGIKGHHYYLNKEKLIERDRNFTPVKYPELMKKLGNK